MACHMALSPKDVIFVNISLRDIGIKVWISCYPAISASFRTVHSSDFFGLDCFALFALPCLLNFQSQTPLCAKFPVPNPPVC